ncbi:MAG: calcium/proton exchanger [Gemmatimonadetes bacterium]|nr:calcium/proton exchanger [Gemmatimonadota bacterium]
MKKLFSSENLLLALLAFVPLAIVLEYLHAGAVAVFIVSSLAIIPLAGLMGRSTEHLAESLGEGIGGLLNATFGNAAELVIAVMALRAGLHDVVKASLTGSIIGNVLLVFGLSTLLGGLRVSTQSFNRTAASLSATMLALSAVALVVPAIFHWTAGSGHGAAERGLSLEIAVVLFLTYVLSLVFTLRTHAHLYIGGAGVSAAARPTAGHARAGGGVLAASPEEEKPGHWSRGTSLAVLLGATALVALMSEFLVGAIEEAAHTLGMSEVFVGVILVALIGNAAEHSTAVLVAMKNKMDLAINIAVGSSIQIALFVAPALVLLSYLVGPRPMDLVFTTFEVVAVSLSVAIIALIALDGESNWMEGVQLLAVYLILGIAFYFLPA